jgi:hypothetical protein
MLMSQKVTSPLTHAQTTRRKMERRRGASRRSSTTITMPLLFHQGMMTMTMKTRQKKKITVNQNYSFDYSRISYNSNAHLLSIPLGKRPHFDGEDYSFWSHKMCNHLFFSILAFGK